MDGAGSRSRRAGRSSETNPERLTRGFAALEADGITAREHFACCHTCGESEIGSVGRPGSPGYVYFHTPCTESGAAGHGPTLL
ncbi:DUF6891 domain-containing protein [Streptomyces erythrochromogenes]|uniref:DUF6891 domain-containing protein n=1 Tax=Streptomyces erythrochromogenes TaxID=285574 RepID=UPI0036790D4D